MFSTHSGRPKGTCEGTTLPLVIPVPWARSPLGDTVKRFPHPLPVGYFSILGTDSGLALCQDPDYFQPGQK